MVVVVVGRVLGRVLLLVVAVVGTTCHRVVVVVRVIGIGMTTRILITLDPGFSTQGYCHDLAKRLSHYLYFFSFSFLFFYLGLTTQREVWESVTSQVSHSHGHMTESHSVTSHDVT